jgi:hypothetical protein
MIDSSFTKISGHFARSLSLSYLINYFIIDDHKIKQNFPQKKEILVFSAYLKIT